MFLVQYYYFFSAFHYINVVIDYILLIGGRVKTSKICWRHYNPSKDGRNNC